MPSINTNNLTAQANSSLNQNKALTTSCIGGLPSHNPNNGAVIFNKLDYAKQYMDPKSSANFKATSSIKTDDKIKKENNDKIEENNIETIDDEAKYEEKSSSVNNSDKKPSGTQIDNFNKSEDIQNNSKNTKPQEKEKNTDTTENKGFDTSKNNTEKEPVKEPEPPQEEAAEKPAPTNEEVGSEPSQPTKPTIADGTPNPEFIDKIFMLINDERAKVNKPALTLDWALCNAAQLKAEDMVKNDYFAHSSPTYGRMNEMLDYLGVSYNGMAENIAYGYRTPEGCMKGFMNSAGHKKNILDEKNYGFTKVGLGYAIGSDGLAYWTQVFAG